MLEELVEKDRLLMRVSAGGVDEYRLQTKESADWFAYQRGEEDALRSDPSAYESKIREQLMQTGRRTGPQADDPAGRQPRNSPTQASYRPHHLAQDRSRHPGVAALRSRRHPGQGSAHRRRTRRNQLGHRVRPCRAAAQG